MAAGTIGVSPVGVGPSKVSIFKTIASKIRAARKNAADAEKYTEKRIKAIERELDEDPENITREDIYELQELYDKKNAAGYFIKKAIRFEATDRIRTALGSFQRRPNIKNDSRASTRERFFAKAGLIRPDKMPDLSNREYPNQGAFGTVTKGFRLMLDSLDNLKKRVDLLSKSSSETSKTVEEVKPVSDELEKSSKKFNEETEKSAENSKKAKKQSQKQQNILRRFRGAFKRNRAETRSEGQDKRGEEGINVIAAGVHTQKSLAALFDRIKKRRGYTPLFGRRKAPRPIKAGGPMGTTTSSSPMGGTAYSDPIGPQPMNSPTPWAFKGPGERGGLFGQGGFAPRLPSTKLSGGGIVMPRMLTNPTQISGASAVIPTERPSGKNLLGSKKESENITKIFQLPQIIGPGMLISGIGEVVQAFGRSVPFFSKITSFIKPILEPIITAFGYPVTVLDKVFGKPGGAGTTPTPTTPKFSVSSGIPGPPKGGGGGRGSQNRYARRNAGRKTASMVQPMTATGGSKPSPNITSGFGMRWNRQHKGIDIAGGGFSQGEPLSIIKPGQVIDRDDLGSEGWGKFIVIKHDDNTHALYGHLDQMYVQKGERVGEGGATVIGTVGNTGRSTGAHLHFELGSGWNGGVITGHTDPARFIDSYVRAGGEVTVDAQRMQATANATAAPGVKGKPFTFNIPGKEELNNILNMNKSSNPANSQLNAITGTNNWSPTAGNALNTPFTTTWNVT